MGRDLPSMRLEAGFLLAIAAIGCGGGSSPVGPTSATATVEFRSRSSEHFVIHYTSIDTATLATIVDRLELQYARITTDLGTTTTGVIDVFFYPDRPSFLAAASQAIGPLPSFATGVVTSSTRVLIVSPSVASLWPLDEGITNTVHESAHCISLRINPSFANNPRWLWEAVAIYEAGQFVDPQTVTELRAAQLPSLATLSARDDTTIYRVGYVLGEFIVSEWGREGLVSLINANGDTDRALQVGEQVFLNRWRAFLRARYGIA